MMSPEGELKVSFGYQCNSDRGIPCKVATGYEILPEIQRTSSFSCLSGAALSANCTLANTNICNGVIGEEILPSLDSPKSFRRVPSSPSLAKLDILSSSLHSSFSNLSCSPSTPSEMLECDPCTLKSMSSPSRSEGFLNGTEVQVAGGAAGEDRVQAVCSEENGWLFCAIYDGFNGRDAADFLACTLYDTIISYFNMLCWDLEPDSIKATDNMGLAGSFHCNLDNSHTLHEHQSLSRFKGSTNSSPPAKSEAPFSNAVLKSLQHALAQVENDFLCMVEQEMEERPDLVCVGSCVLLVLLHRNYLYTLNLGDSRAVLATRGTDGRMNGNERLKAIQLTNSHTVDDEAERAQLLANHPDDPKTIVAGKVKGKLKVTRAFGVGYLKKKNLNDALMGILRVSNLKSPPYVSTDPSVNVHKISNSDQFVIVGSDGLFDFFSNDEAVKLVESYILSNPYGDPAKFLIEQLVVRAADSAGFSMEELMNIPAGRRRKYHDDVTVMVVMLGMNQRTSKASICI
ncbi:probable protein phosphatase 2C 40 [Lotus japonicus]|uniref:probable protein phosphatase 2C 40 n=1 Tax=Lotus japonicus TaxID=34305 RepID=UPI002590230F|nr:probable protein phosphatase 2C 40 [Lotus japonicus]XP_057430369.1 probable protein phosphatase 2C 40 [Lotus japonicus]XP_057430370.1 probable protein phosphatase 2C 40 [Lotus japonicus]XP_057430371.1 probable protein phosphatase 2C 40 [Lotus japonicus]XP_057430373.1 probable protein phosphatase 2C 40 [Lotus japonicus]